MENNFKKLKNKLRFWAIFKCALFGVALAVIAASAYVIVQKFMTVLPQAITASVIGISTALVSFGIGIAIVRPTEKRLAKIIDERLSLGEKVQTMVAFRNDTSVMANIQREDTEEILSAADKNKLRSSRWWVSLIPSLLAATLAVTAFVLPVKTPDPITPPGTDIQNDVWELTEWHIMRMRTLIEKVEKSEMVDDGKSRVVDILEALITSLEDVKSNSQMKTIVIDAMIRIDGVTDGINTFTSVVRAMRQSSNTSVFGFSETIGIPSDPITESKYQALRVSFKKENATSELTFFAKDLMNSLNGTGISRDDALYIAIKDYSDALEAFSDSIDKLTEDEYSSGLTKIFEASAEKISLALTEQNQNRVTSDSTNRELMEIFDVEWAELPEELRNPNDEEAGTFDGSYDDTNKDEELVGNGGGLGGGDVLYGSNDAVYDPDRGEKVVYGEIIDKYDGKKTTELDERSFSDELREWIDDYFSDLYYNDKNND